MFSPFEFTRKQVAKICIPPHYSSGETTHHEIAKAHYEAMESKPVVVRVTDPQAKAFKERQMVSLDDAIIWLVLAANLPDGQAHDLADLDRCWYDGKLFEIKEVMP